MKLYSQRDDRWKLKKLGFSNVSIGNFGCAMTCYAMMWNTEPDKVNEWFKNNGCFAQENLIWWAKTPGFVWRSWSYENDKVKEAIDKYGACIVETDFNNNPKDGSHFVLFIGNGKMYDPWDGKEKPTSSYNVFYGYCIVDPSKNPFKEEDMSDDEMVIKKTIFEELVRKSSLYDTFNSIGYGSAAEVSHDLSERDNSIKKLKEDLQSEKSRAETARTTYNNLLAMVAKSLDTQQEENQVKTALDKVNKQLDELDDLQRNFATLQLSSEKEKDELNATIAHYKALLEQKDVLAEAKIEELLTEIIKRLKTILKLGR